MSYEPKKQINLYVVKKACMRNAIITIFVISVLISCKTKSEKINPAAESQDPLLLSVLWYQRSAEMQSLYYLGYNIAKSSLSERLKKSDNKKPKAVIMDIDETVLDNSPVEAFQVINNVPFSDSLWERWVSLCAAEPLPGAIEFARFAESSGVEIFYVSNRSAANSLGASIKNLSIKGFPFADSIHVVLKTGESSKEKRRLAIAGKYEILLLMGDNLGDLDIVFETRGDDLGFAALSNNVDEFGSKFIVFPNSMYGSWINAAIKNSPGNSAIEKLKNSIKSF
jgi:5'-nucleotidase (lipoprotein e(P4) family)